MALDHDMTMKMGPVTDNGVFTNHTIRPNFDINADLGFCCDNCS